MSVEAAWLRHPSSVIGPPERAARLNPRTGPAVGSNEDPRDGGAPRVRDADDLEVLCTRRLDHAEFPRVYIDAAYVKIHVDDVVVFEALVAATGATRDGTVEILGFSVGDSEGKAFWEQMLISLRSRGLRGVERVVTSEEHGGLERAVAAVFPGARLEVVGEGHRSDPVPPACR